MHPEILSKEQHEILTVVSLFKREYYMVGGTAIALQIAHRRSIDFDLFKTTTINRKKILDTIHKTGFDYKVNYTNQEQLNLTIHGVKFTFFQFPYPIPHPLPFEKHLYMPTLLDLAAMKAFALGKRSKWKDYVDLYFLIKYHFSITEISDRALVYFIDLFSEKLFRNQLAYHTNINYEEEVEYLVTPIPMEAIKAFLIDKATELF